MSEDSRLALTTLHIGEPIKKRYGCQYSKAYSNDRFYITIDNFTSHLQKDADITSLFVRRSVFHAFWGGRDDEQDTDNTNQHGVNSEGANAQDQQMPDVDRDSNQDANTQDRQMSDVDEADQDANNPDHTREISVPASLQEHEMRDRPVAVHLRTILPRRKKSRRRIRIRQPNKKNKAPKNISLETPPDRSSALTAFISSPPSLESYNISQPNLL